MSIPQAHLNMPFEAVPGQGFKRTRQNIVCVSINSLCKMKLLGTFSHKYSCQDIVLESKHKILLK